MRRARRSWPTRSCAPRTGWRRRWPPASPSRGGGKMGAIRAMAGMFRWQSLELESSEFDDRYKLSYQGDKMPVMMLFTPKMIVDMISIQPDDFAFELQHDNLLVAQDRPAARSGRAGRPARHGREACRRGGGTRERVTPAADERAPADAGRCRCGHARHGLGADRRGDRDLAVRPGRRAGGRCPAPGLGGRLPDDHEPSGVTPVEPQRGAHLRRLRPDHRRHERLLLLGPGARAAGGRGGPGDGRADRSGDAGVEAAARPGGRRPRGGRCRWCWRWRRASTGTSLRWASRSRWPPERAGLATSCSRLTRCGRCPAPRGWP